MSKNLIPQIAHMLGVELGEEFKIGGYDDSNTRTYKFTAQGLRVKLVEHPEATEFNALAALNSLLVGDIEIVKLPWKPKMDERYWTFGLGVDGKWIVIARRWEGYPCEFLLVDKGWAYRREKEAKAALPSVAKELGVEFVAKTVEENLF
nr:MAG TPA: hypothetical protein [Caudoviricetes sp.]